MTVWRPCDATETARAWADAIERRDGPTVLVLTRQALPAQPRTRRADRGDSPRRLRAEGLRGHARSDPDRDGLRGRPRGRGGARCCNKKVGACVSCRCRARACSTRRTRAIANECCRGGRTRVAVEAAAPETWWRYVGIARRVVGMTSFGASGGAKDLFKHFGFTARECRRAIARAAVSTLEVTSNGDQSRHQRLRPHRPQHPARALRGEAHRRRSRSSRSTTSATRRPTRT